MKRFLCLLTAACLLPFAGCSFQKEEEPASVIDVYQALPLPDLFLNIPEGYEKTSSDMIEEYYLKDDASIIATEDPVVGCNDLHAYAINALLEYEKVATEVSNTQDGVVQAQDTLVQTLEFDYTLGADGGLKLHCIAGYLTDGKSVYIITCKSQQDTFESHREEFMTVLSSARIDKAPAQ